MKSRYSPYVPLAILFALAATYQVRFYADAVQQLNSPTELAQYPLNTQPASALISYAGAEAKQAGVYEGDRLLSVNNLPYTGGNNPYANLPVWVVIPALLLVFLFPLTMAYVIVVHRAMDVRVVLRQGVQYALARNGVRFMQIILSAIVIFVAASLIASHAANRPKKIIIMAGGVLLVFLLQGIAERLRRFVDRRFFREAYNAEQILSDLSEKVRTIVETRPLLETVAERISESLHVPRVALMLKDGGDY